MTNDEFAVIEERLIAAVLEDHRLRDDATLKSFYESANKATADRKAEISSKTVRGMAPDVQANFANFMLKKKASKVN